MPFSLVHFFFGEKRNEQSIFDVDPLNQLFYNTDLQYFKEQIYNQLKLFDL